MDVDGQLRAFQTFLNQSWHTAIQGMGSKDEELLDDWKQANWELLVEAVLLGPGQFLSVYGDGADCNGASSRVWKPAATPTHAVHVVPAHGPDFQERLTGTKFTCPRQGLPMDRFVAISNASWYEPEPPFDHVLVALDGREKIFAITDVCFILTSLKG